MESDKKTYMIREFRKELLLKEAKSTCETGILLKFVCEMGSHLHPPPPSWLPSTTSDNHRLLYDFNWLLCGVSRVIL